MPAVSIDSAQHAGAIRQIQAIVALAIGWRQDIGQPDIARHSEAVAPAQDVDRHWQLRESVSDHRSAQTFCSQYVLTRSCSCLCCAPCRVALKSSPCLLSTLWRTWRRVLRLSRAFLAAQPGNAVITAQAVENDPDLVFCGKMPTGLAADGLHHPLSGGLHRRFCIGGFGLHLMGWTPPAIGPSMRPQ